MIRTLRTINFMLAITAAIALVAVYGQKHMAELTAGDIRRIESAIARQQADLSILKADWAYLNQPSHIQPIVDRHNELLGLQVAKATQFGSFADLPMRPERRLDTESLDALFEAIEQGGDPIGSLLEGIL